MMCQTDNVPVESYLVMPSRLFFALVIVLSASGSSAQPPASAFPATVLPLRLVGVAKDSTDADRSAGLIRCSRDGTGSARLVPVGGRACDVADVREVYEGGVVLWNVQASRLEWLALPESARPSVLRPPAAAETPTPRTSDDIAAPVVQPSTGDIVNVEVSQALLHRYMSNLAEVLNAALALPHYTSGSRTVDGFEMSRVKSGGIVEQLGIRDGDVLLEYNGQKLDSLPAVTALFAQAQSIAGGRLKVLRDGRVLTFVFTVR